MTRTTLLVIVLAACGSKSPSTPTVPTESHDHGAGTGSGRAVTAAGPGPAEAAAPAEPTAPDPATIKAELRAAERAAWDAAKPVFDASCATCHTKAGKKSAKKKLDHFDMDVYPPGGHHTSTIGFTVAEVLGITGKKPTMPFDKPGSVKGDDLAKVKAWTEAWTAAETGGAHTASAKQD